MELLFNIVICDDDAVFLDTVYKKVSEIALQNDCRCKITQLYSGNELIDYCKNNAVDIILTDIDMPDFSSAKNEKAANTDGFKAAKTIQDENPGTEVLFISAHEELAYQSFRYRPFSFVSKRDLGMLEEDLGELLQKLRKRKTQNSLFHLTVGKKSYSINTDEIMYFRSDRHYIRSYGADGKEKSYRLSINEAYDQLKEADFIFAHRSYLVNCKFIKYFDTRLIILTDGLEINVTRDSKKSREAQYIFGKYKRSLR